MLLVGTFFICLFIFMMQFLWRYVDEMVGKGLELTILAQFFFYAAVTLVPLSLPLAILLAALITFGNFGERFELLAMKAAGISLLQIMRPLIILVLLISSASFYFQDVICPKAQTKLLTLLVSMRQKSPELDIPEGAFYDQIEGYNLFVKRKNRETGMLYDVMIYNFAKGFENAQIIRADSGKLEMTGDRQHLYLHLYSGEQFENLQSQSLGQRRNNIPYRRESFSSKHALIEFDSDFNLIDAGLVGGSSSGKSLSQLQVAIDSMQVKSDSIGRDNYNQAIGTIYSGNYFLSKQDSLKVASARLGDYDSDSLFNAATLVQKQQIISRAFDRTLAIGGDWSIKSLSLVQTQESLRRHQTAWHEKFTLSLACLIFFFIGAPLGGIIRKGGLGMPVIVSVLIFIFYYIINQTGYKMARDGKWIIWMGMWLSTFVLAPLGAYLTYKSNNDSVVLNLDTYLNWLKRVAGIRQERHFFRKEVIIHDPDYPHLLVELQQHAELIQRYISENKLKDAPNYLTLWMNKDEDKAIYAISQQLESLIEELSNSKSHVILSRLEKYPLFPLDAHLRPFRSQWANIICGLVLPVGLFFYVRIWIFRVRLYKDLQRIMANHQELITAIKAQTQGL